jgi:hypothetical protein
MGDAKRMIWRGSIPSIEGMIKFYPQQKNIFLSNIEK